MYLIKGLLMSPIEADVVIKYIDTYIILISNSTSKFLRLNSARS